MATRVCETIVTGLSLACFVVIFILHFLMFSGRLQKDLFKRRWSLAEGFSKKIIVTLVTQRLPSSFLSRPVA